MPDATCALILDMDGVIVDSNPVHRVAWDQFNQRYGIATTDDMQQRMYGKRNDEIVRDFFGPSLTASEVIQRGAEKELLYRELIGPLLPGALVRGVKTFLERHQDLPIGCATNAEGANLTYVLEQSGIASLFRVAVDGQQVRRGKPFPDIYLLTAERLRVAPQRCLVFEDSYAGIEAAVAAGMTVVGVRTTHPSFQNVAMEIDDFTAPDLDAFVSRFCR